MFGKNPRQCGGFYWLYIRNRIGLSAKKIPHKIRGETEFRYFPHWKTRKRGRLGQTRADACRRRLRLLNG